MQSDDYMNLDKVAIHGTVTVKSERAVELHRKKDGNEKLYSQLTTEKGEISELDSIENYGYDYEHAKKLGKHYENGDKNSPNKLLVTSTAGDIVLFNP